MTSMIFLFLTAVAVAFGSQFARYFSASWGFLTAIALLAILVYFQLRKRFSVDEPVIDGIKANPAALALFLCLVGSYVTYCFGALITALAGSETTTDATVLSTNDARRCDSKVTARLEDGRTAYYCAGQALRNGSRVRLRTRSTLLGVLAKRG